MGRPRRCGLDREWAAATRVASVVGCLPTLGYVERREGSATRNGTLLTCLRRRREDARDRSSRAGDRCKEPAGARKMYRWSSPAESTGRPNGCQSSLEVYLSGGLRTVDELGIRLAGGPGAARDNAPTAAWPGDSSRPSAPSLLSMSTSAPPALHHNWQELRAGAELAAIRSGDVTFHTLRHTVLGRMIAAGHSAHTVMAISGHSTTRMLERYTHPTQTLKVDALETGLPCVDWHKTGTTARRHPARDEGLAQIVEEKWWTARGSNSRPPRCERGALPAELAAHSD